MQQSVALAAGAGSARAGRIAASALRGLRQWAAAERGRFALWLPVVMGAGVIAELTASNEPAWPWLGATVALAGLAGVVAMRAWPLPCAVCAAVAAGGLGFGSAQFATWRAAPLVELPRKATVVTGTVRAFERLPEGGRVTLNAPSLDGGAALPRRLRIRLRNTDEIEPLPGERLRLRAMLTPPAPPAFPGAWDLQRDAFFAGIGGYGFALGRAETIEARPPTGPATWLQSYRAWVALRVHAALPAEDGAEGAIAATLLTGFTSAIPEPVKEAFRNSGLAHLLAIAGLHIGIVMGLVLGAARLLLAAWEYAALRWPTKQIAVLTALAAGGAYMMMTGAHVPIIRSFAMACLVAVGVLAGRRSVSLRGLALAAVALMLIAPNEVLGVSFQMSFSAVLALIAGYEALREPLRRLRAGGSAPRRLLLHVVALALTSALAGTASAPYAAYHFGRVQVYYVLANMIAVPITALWVMPLGLAALALMPLHLEIVPLVPMGWGIDAIVWIGRAVSALPAAVFAVPHIPAWGLATLSLGIAWLGLWRSRMRLAGIVAIIAGLISPAFDQPPDILVSADARMIAVRTRAGAFEQAHSGASHFTRDAWLQYWAEPAFAALPWTGAAAAGAIDCVDASCTLRPRPDSVAALLLRDKPTKAECAADLLISAEPIRLRCRPKVAQVDRFDVWRNGAHAVWLDADGARVLSDREWRGDRPWVPPPPVPRWQREQQ